jgi:uncharacterized SAM-binding protein YcdF (DUF218 family)
MNLGELKPVLTALAVPPAAPLLLGLFGLLLVLARRRRLGATLSLLGLGSLWLLSCQAFAVLLADRLLAMPPPAQPQQVAQVQAIVVLGGGVLPQAPEYGAAQPHPSTLGRLRYGAWLARQTGQPLGFAGGIGWSATGHGTASEAEVAARTLQESFGLPLRWSEGRSRDTEENAREMRRLLAAEGIARIALVTDAWHMPRSVHHFQAAGFQVLPAPTDYPLVHTRLLLAWLPSSEGLHLSRQVIRELLGLWLARGLG